MREAKGEFIVFMDPDDLYPSRNVLERLYFSAKNNGLLSVGGSLQSFTPDGNIIANSKKKNVFDCEKNVNFTEYQWAMGYQRFIFSRLLLSRYKIQFPPFLRFQDPPFMAAALLVAEEFRSIPDVTYSYRIGYKKVDWKADNYRRFRDLLKALGMMAEQAARAELQELMKLVESELVAHLENIVKPDDVMLSECSKELNLVRSIISRFCEKDKVLLPEEKVCQVKLKFQSVQKISLLKILVPYEFMRRCVARKYGYKWPAYSGGKGWLPFFIATSLMQRVSSDCNIIKYFMPYKMMCDHMFAKYGYTEWNGVPLDVTSSQEKSFSRRRAFLPFGMILFLDKHSK